MSPEFSESIAGTTATPRLLMVWDAPNMDMGLGGILGGRPTAAHRPRFDALGRWILKRNATIAATLRQEVELEATVFTNIVPGSADVCATVGGGSSKCRLCGFAKPKLTDDSDVDSDMLDHIQVRRHTPGLAGIIVASADGQAFREPLLEIAADGVPVTVIGFREHASWALTCDDIEFIDPRTSPASSANRYRESAWTPCPTTVPG